MMSRDLKAIIEQCNIEILEVLLSDIKLKILKFFHSPMNLFKDLVQFWNAMGTLPWKIKIWAILYPLPQLLGGLYFIRETPGLVILIGRVLSFFIGSQVHRRRPFSKLIGPIGHAHWLLILPYLLHLLMIQTLDTSLYWFIVYVCVISMISAIIDILDVVQYFQHGESSYKRG